MQDLSHYADRNLSQLFHAFAGSNFHIDMHVNVGPVKKAFLMGTGDLIPVW